MGVVNYLLAAGIGAFGALVTSIKTKGGTVVLPEKEVDAKTVALGFFADLLEGAGVGACAVEVAAFFVPADMPIALPFTLPFIFGIAAPKVLDWLVNKFFPVK